MTFIKIVARYFFLVFIISFILPSLAVSQTTPRDFSADGDQRNPLAGGCFSTSAGKELGAIKDIKFKTNEYNVELDLYCFYDTDPDMRFPIYVYIDREAVVGDKVTLELLAWDIDTDYQGGGGCGPEVPTVSFNGHSLGVLTGNNGVWSPWETQIPKAWVNFLGDSGEFYGENWVTIIRDAQPNCWASAVDYGRLKMRVYPLVFVPGMAASDLHNAQAGPLRFKEAWPQIVESLSSDDDDHLDVLALEEDGVTEANPNADLYPGLPLALAHGGMKDYYRDKGILAPDSIGKFESEIPSAIRKITPVEKDNIRYFEYGYDWRKRLELASAGLSFKVLDVIKKTGMDKIVVMAHSMGGLVFRDYQRDDSDKIKMFLSMGSPYHGAAKGYGILKYASSFDSHILGAGAFDDDKMSELGQNFPGVYALLPTQSYFNTYGYVVNDQFDDGGASSNGKLNLVQTYLTDPQTNLSNPGLVNWAIAFANKQVNFAPGMDMYLVYGVTKKKWSDRYKDGTIQQFKLTKTLLGNPSFKELMGAGDETVPMRSAGTPLNTLQGIDERKVVFHAHTPMATADDVMDYTWNKYTGVASRDPSLGFSGFSDQGIDTNGDGLFDSLDLSFTANADVAGNYTLFGLLRDGSGVHISSTYTSSVLTTGSNTILFSFPGYHFFDQEVNGSYALTVQTYFNDQFQDEQESLYSTNNYFSARFEPYPNITLADNFDILSFTEGSDDTDSDGDIDFVEITMDVNITLYDTYDVLGLLSSNISEPVTYAYESSTLREGIHPLTLSFDAKELAKISYDTPFNLSLTVADTEGNVLKLPHVYTTFIQTSANFTEQQATLTGNMTDVGVDIDSNGFYDDLNVSFAVDVKESGTYTLYASLSTNITENTTFYLGTTSTTSFLNSGARTLRVSFDGVAINQSGINGPYIVRDAQLYFNGELADELSFVDFTRYYTSAQFEQPLITIGDIYDYGLDTNGNGLYDFLVVTMEVRAKQANTYTAGTRLFDRNYTELAREEDTKFGASFNYTFLFDGKRVYSFRVPGPYIMKNLVINFNGGYYLWGDSYLTHNYTYLSFEHDTFPISPTPKFAYNQSVALLDPANNTVSSKAFVNAL